MFLGDFNNACCYQTIDFFIQFYSVMCSICQFHKFYYETCHAFLVLFPSQHLAAQTIDSSFAYIVGYELCSAQVMKG